MIVALANGFIGRELMAKLAAQKSIVRGAVRHSGVITHG